MHSKATNSASPFFSAGRSGHSAGFHAVILAAVLLAAATCCHASVAQLPKVGTYSDELAKCRQAGVPTDLNSLLSPRPKDSENAAVIYAMLPSGQKSWKSSVEKLSELMQTPYSVQLPQTANEIDQIIAQHRDELALIHEAVSKPKCRFKHDHSDPEKNFDGIDMIELHDSAIMLEAESLSLASRGDEAEALQDVGNIFKIADQTQQDFPCLSSSFTATVLQAVAFHAFDIILWITKDDDATLNDAETVLEKRFHPIDMRKVYRNEIALMINTTASEYADQPAEYGFSPESEMMNYGGKTAASMGSTAYYNANRAALLSRMRQLMTIGNGTVKQIDQFKMVVAKECNSENRFLYLESRDIQMEQNASLFRSDTIKNADIIELSLQILRYKSKHTVFPASLEQLPSIWSSIRAPKSEFMYWTNSSSFVIATDKSLLAPPVAGEPWLNYVWFEWPVVLPKQ